MRELKFKAWDKEINKMMYPIFGFTEKEVLILNSLGVVSKGRDKFDLLEYINRKDKNGKEIYEADILNLIYGDDKQTAQVKWSDNIYGGWILMNIHLPQAQIWSDDCEIIGNIYENPELLEKQAV